MLLKIAFLGAGRMASAILDGLLNTSAASPTDIAVLGGPGPTATALATRTGALLATDLPDLLREADLVVIAFKPQHLAAADPRLAELTRGKLVLSVLAAKTLARLARTFPHARNLVRTMPNTPAMVGRGITAICGNTHATPDDLILARALMAAVGEVVDLAGEHQIDAVTAVSGSGPAYVFHLIEAMAAAGEAQGLPPDIAMQLARATVCGAGELAHRSPDTAAQLRVNVTSPGGTTAAALAVLMDPDTGLTPLLQRAVKAAADRGRDLGK